MDESDKGGPQLCSNRAANLSYYSTDRSNPVVCTYWKNGVPGGIRLGSRNVLSNTQLRVGGS